MQSSTLTLLLSAVVAVRTQIILDAGADGGPAAPGEGFVDFADIGGVPLRQMTG